jgi:hypothetical protein
MPIPHEAFLHTGSSHSSLSFFRNRAVQHGQSRSLHGSNSMTSSFWVLGSLEPIDTPWTQRNWTTNTSLVPNDRPRFDVSHVPRWTPLCMQFLGTLHSNRKFRHSRLVGGRVCSASIMADFFLQSVPVCGTHHASFPTVTKFRVEWSAKSSTLSFIHRRKRPLYHFHSQKVSVETAYLGGCCMLCSDVGVSALSGVPCGIVMLGAAATVLRGP